MFREGELHLTLWHAHGETAVISAFLLSMWEALGGEGGSLDTVFGIQTVGVG